MRVLITGAGRGIGRATAVLLAGSGAKLALMARSSDQLEEVAREVRERGGEASVHPVDLADPAAIEAVAQAAIRALGGALDGLIHNAGLFDMRPIEDMTLAFWERMLRVNLTAPMLLTRACLEALEAGVDPVIVHVASVAAEEGFPGNTAYCASKYGLKGLADALRCDLAPRGIAVRTVYPGATATTIFDDVAGGWDKSSMASPTSVAELISAALLPDAPDDLRPAS